MADNGKRPTPSLPPDRAKTVEAGLLMFQEISAERDQLRTEVGRLKHDITQDRVELEALRSLVTTLESRVTTHQAERDQAVADRAVYEALFISVNAQLRAFNVPSAPLVKQLAREFDPQDTADMMKQIESEINK